MTRAIRTAALVGNPNAGKSALFNALTGARQKIANYPGVTVERKSGRMLLPSGEPVELIDLPGSYGLDATSPDEAVTRRVILGEMPGESRPDALVIVLDAGNLEQHLVFAQEVIALGRPTVVALNMVDLAERDGLVIDPAALQVALGVPVVATIAVRRRGLEELSAAIAAAEDHAGDPAEPRPHVTQSERRLTAHAIADGAILSETARHRLHSRLDKVLLHPWLGPIILFALLFVVFQAVFAWATPFADGIEAGIGWLSQGARAIFPAGLPRDLLTDGILSGVGSVIVFLPQIIILFFFILVMEATGYMARAAFLMDRLMAGVGLSGRSFIPLLSSFACAIPGIMATRSITDPKDRLTTILIAPLMTCSARIPVYTLIISAFIPARQVWGFVSLQGLVMFGLYVAGIASALGVSSLIKFFLWRDYAPAPFMLELPDYKMPRPKSIAIGVYTRAKMFLQRAGTTIFSMMVLIWFLASFPQPPDGATDPAINYSLAAMIGKVLEPLLAPVGFNWQIAVALIPGMAAREVAVAALGTVYAIEGGKEAAEQIGQVLATKWSLATALSLLAWFIFAPQCASTLAVIRRETASWTWMWVTFGYMFVLAYAASFATYNIAVAFGAG